MSAKTEFKVGLFIILSALLILSGLGYVAYKKDFFFRRNRPSPSHREPAKD